MRCPSSIAGPALLNTVRMITKGNMNDLLVEFARTATSRLESCPGSQCRLCELLWKWEWEWEWKWDSSSVALTTTGKRSKKALNDEAIELV